jgi:hypothetical protein
VLVETLTLRVRRAQERRGLVRIFSRDEVPFQIVVEVKLSNQMAQRFLHGTRRNGIAPKSEATNEISSHVKWTV